MVYCNYCKCDTHWMKHKDRKTGDITYICPKLIEKKKKEKQKKKQERVRNNFNKTLRDVQNLPWDQLKIVKEDLMNDLLYKSTVIWNKSEASNILSGWYKNACFDGKKKKKLGAEKVYFDMPSDMK